MTQMPKSLKHYRISKYRTHHKFYKGFKLFKRTRIDSFNFIYCLTLLYITLLHVIICYAIIFMVVKFYDTVTLFYIYITAARNDDKWHPVFSREVFCRSQVFTSAITVAK